MRDHAAHMDAMATRCVGCELQQAVGSPYRDGERFSGCGFQNANRYACGHLQHWDQSLALEIELVKTDGLDPHLSILSELRVPARQPTHRHDAPIGGEQEAP